MKVDIQVSLTFQGHSISTAERNRLVLRVSSKRRKVYHIAVILKKGNCLFICILLSAMIVFLKHIHYAILFVYYNIFFSIINLFNDKK